MIIVYKENIPVACYEGVSHSDALISYADEVCGRVHTAASINIIGANAVECRCKKYSAIAVTEGI
jgi:hypothetical protein